MKTKFPLKPFDFAVIGAAALLTAYCAFSAYAGAREGGRVLVRGSGGRWIFPLDAEETVEVPGPLGVTVVEIKDLRVRVVSSPCANQTCVASGHIGSGGQWTACLPNEVLVVIEGGAGGPDVDTGTW
ncbi:MAG: NusG domain II-containing protein [Treponema sp.]|jgi:hypothetical protein|nr:NusG domain II-containing protein [Treponema sp.]